MFEYFLTQLGEGSFVFQIEAQDDRVTNYVKSVGTFYASNGWSVTIDNEPEIDLDKKVIYLRGRNSELDTKVDRFWGLGGKECKETMKKIDQAIRECVEAAKTWKRKYPLEFRPVVVVNHNFCAPFVEVMRAMPTGYIIVR